MADKSARDIISSPVALTNEEAAAIESYWTVDRMRSAIPLPLPEIEGEPQDIEAPAPLAPSAENIVVQDAIEPDAEEGPLTETPCFVTTRVSNLTVSPYKYCGKLYMTFGGSNYVGSAWCICKYSIFTAGHCVYNHGTGWATNLVFKGRYNNGSQAGTWVIRQAAAPRGWIDDRDFAYDLGAGISNGNIQSVIGSAGWLANAAADQGQIDSIGYPAQAIAGYNFNGEHMWHCLGKYLSGTSILKMCNNMTGGCSGGPWSVNNNGNHRMNGVNSHRYSSDPNSMYSPYFGDTFLKLVQWLRDNNGC